MYFDEWLKHQQKGIIKKIDRLTEIDPGLCNRARLRQPISYRNAKRLSHVTGGAVTIKELCDPEGYEVPRIPKALSEFINEIIPETL